jgi:PIN domain nuclease of toxin-antitoxin system
MGGGPGLRLLLDTHIWLWSLGNASRLSGRVARKVQATDTELWVSPVSTWELALLEERKRIKLRGGLRAWLGDALARLPVNEATLTHEIALESRTVDVPHRDPADRLLVATAKVLDLALVTADERLFRVKSCAVLANR